MKTLSNLNLGTSLIAATLTAATVVAVAPAQAAVLNLSDGDILNISGQSTFPLDADLANLTLDFLQSSVGTNSTGGFFQNYVVGGETLDFVSDIDLTRVGGAGSTLYEAIATNPLLTFSDGVQFVANNPFEVVRSATGNNGVALTFNPFSGEFVNAQGATVAQGLFTAQQFFDADGSYSMTISAEEVPEPLTTLGTGLALGFGGLFQRKNSRKRKNQ